MGNGDLDDLEGTNEYTVRSNPRWTSRRRGNDALVGTPGQIPAGLATLGERSEEDSLSTTVASSSPTRPSNEREPTSVSGGGEDSGDGVGGLPGLRMLDINNGISRFLH